MAVPAGKRQLPRLQEMKDWLIALDPERIVWQDKVNAMTIEEVAKTYERIRYTQNYNGKVDPEARRRILASSSDSDLVD